MIKSLINPIARRVSLMVGRALLAAASAGGNRQFVQITSLAGEVKDNVEHVQPYGFASRPLNGAQVVFLCVGGSRDHMIAVCIDDPRHRPPLEPGEAAIWTDEGDIIHLKRDRTIEVTTLNLVVKAAEKARFETPVLECTGEIHDRCDDQPDTMNGMRSIYNSHVHPENGSAGPTDPPNQQMGGA